MSHSLLPENPVPLNNEVEARYAGKNIVMPGFGQSTDSFACFNCHFPAHPFAFYSQQVGTDSDCLGALDHFDPPLSPELEALDTGAKSDFFVGNNHLTPKETKKPEWKDIDSIVHLKFVQNIKTHRAFRLRKIARIFAARTQGFCLHNPMSMDRILKSHLKAAPSLRSSSPQPLRLRTDSVTWLLALASSETMKPHWEEKR